MIQLVDDSVHVTAPESVHVEEHTHIHARSVHGVGRDPSPSQQKKIRNCMECVWLSACMALW